MLSLYAPHPPWQRHDGCIKGISHESNARAYHLCNYCNFKFLSKLIGSANACTRFSGHFSLTRILISSYVCGCIQTNHVTDVPSIAVKMRPISAQPHKQLYKFDMLNLSNMVGDSIKKQTYSRGHCSRVWSHQYANLKSDEMSFGLDIAPLKADRISFKDAMKAMNSAHCLHTLVPQKILIDDAWDVSYSEYGKQQQVHLS